MKFGYCTITWGGIAAEPGGVGSIADLYYRSLGDIVEAANAIAAEGYAGIEVFDGNLVALESRASEVKQSLDRAEVELVSVYTGANFIYQDALDDESRKIENAARLANVFGASHLVIGGGARRGSGIRDEDFISLARGLDRAASIAADAGLTSSYHPHLGTLVQSPEELAKLMPLTSIGFCPDTGHLAAGGGDPAEEIRRYGERLAHVHFKDFDESTGSFVPLGQGNLKFGEILSAVRAQGYDEWIMVELDAFEADPRMAAAMSKAHMNSVLASA